MNPTTQRYWTEGKIINGTNVGGGRLVEGTPTATPTATPPVTRTPSLLETARKEAEIAASDRASAQAEADSYAARQRQARIDAINTTFAPRIERAKKEGESNLARVSAINLKSGVIGSGVDTANIRGQKELNENELKALEDTKATAINQAFGWADELAKQRAGDTYNLAKMTAEAKVKRLSDQASLAENALKVFGSQGKTAEQLKSVDPNTYATLRDTLGMTDSGIDTYLKVNAPKGTYEWSQAKTYGSKIVVPYIDPLTKIPTMTTLDLGFTPSKGVKSVDKTSNNDFLLTYTDGTHKVVKVGGTKSSFSDVIQQAIDAGATPEQAAREAAIASENNGIQVNQDTLSQWTQEARNMKKTEVKDSKDVYNPYNLGSTSISSDNGQTREANPFEKDGFFGGIYDYLFNK